ncbi:MAG: DUF429 domain-containing protein [Thaumarchaeota archaeon]|nr:MAG: DUF429 domain-containing protein [Nitrososphaerota archaeon]
MFSLRLCLDGLWVVGVDLAGSSRRVTGLCRMGFELAAEVSKAYSDDEILAFASRDGVNVIAIDAPLTYPAPGRSFRSCDAELRRIGVRLFPPLLGPMKALTDRGVRLRKILEKRGYKVIEVFPTGARGFLRLPPKRAGREALREALSRLGVRGIPENADQHMLDAVICALIGLYYLKGEYVEFGSPEEGVIVMPKPRL